MLSVGYDVRPSFRLHLEPFGDASSVHSDSILEAFATDFVVVQGIIALIAFQGIHFEKSTFLSVIRFERACFNFHFPEDFVFLCV